MHRFYRWLFYSVLATAAFLTACTEEAQPEAESPSASVTASPQAMAPPLSDAGGGTVVFLRGQADPQYLTGAIWISDLDGANAKRVTPEGARASYVGLAVSKSGGTLIYFATQDAEGSTTVYDADLDTGKIAPVLTYPDIPDYYYADVSPDGRYLVHTQPLGLDMYDFATGTNATLFQSGSGPDCLANVIEQCYRAIAPDWSPDGRLLSVTHSVYEGGWAEVVDPFQTPPTVFTAGDRSYPRVVAWSPGSDAVCAQSVGLGDPSGLYLLESPDWEARNLFPEFEDYTANPDSRQVVGCDWVNANEVAFLTMVERPQRQGELWVYNRGTGDSALIVTLPEGTGCCGGVVVAVPGTDHVIAQVLQDEGGSDFPWSQPAVVNVRTGETYHILEKDDIILDAFSP